MSKQIK